MRAVTLYLWCNSFRCPREEKSANSWPHTSALQASDFESDENYFRGFLHRYSFPYFLTRFLTDFLHIRHADFNGEHLSYLNKTNWPKLLWGVRYMHAKQRTSNLELADLVFFVAGRVSDAFLARNNQFRYKISPFFHKPSITVVSKLLHAGRYKTFRWQVGLPKNWEWLHLELVHVSDHKKQPRCQLNNLNILRTFLKGTQAWN